MAALESFDEEDIQQMLVDIAGANSFVEPKIEAREKRIASDEVVNLFTYDCTTGSRQLTNFHQQNAEHNVRTFLFGLLLTFEFFCVARFEVSIATKPGDNYLGRVFRAIVREDGKEPLSLIFKTAPVSKIRRDTFNSGVVFSNEGSMYCVILPAFNALLREYGISNSDVYPCTPRCLRTRISADWKENALDVIVLEDMSVKGYRTVERSVGLDAEQCRVILRQLALLHASSFALRHHRPDEARDVESVLKQDQNLMADMLQSTLAMMKSNMYLIEDRYPAGSLEHTKLKNFIDNFVDVANTLLYDKEKDQFKCITHGDCWSNNILFKYDKNGRIEDICLIDFQIALVTSPASDILCVLIACTTKKTREHLDSLIRDYYEELSSHLKTMGCDPESIYPWSTLQEQLKKHSGFALCRALVAIPLFLADSSEIPENIDTLMESNDYKDFADVFTSVKDIRRIDECKERMSDVLADYIAFGYL